MVSSTLVFGVKNTFPLSLVLRDLKQSYPSYVPEVDEYIVLLKDTPSVDFCCSALIPGLDGQPVSLL